MSRKGTAGAKFVALLKKYEGKVFLAEFSEDSAKFLISQAIKQPSKEAYDITVKLLGELPPYDAPTPSYAEKPAGEGKGDEGKEPGEEPSPKEDLVQNHLQTGIILKTKSINFFITFNLEYEIRN